MFLFGVLAPRFYFGYSVFYLVIFGLFSGFVFGYLLNYSGLHLVVC